MPCWKGSNNYNPNKKQNNNSTVKLTSFSKLPSIRKKKDSLTVQFKSNLSNSKSKSKKLGCLG